MQLQHSLTRTRTTVAGDASLLNDQSGAPASNHPFTRAQDTRATVPAATIPNLLPTITRAPDQRGERWGALPVAAAVQNEFLHILHVSCAPLLLLLLLLSVA